MRVFALGVVLCNLSGGALAQWVSVQGFVDQQANKPVAHSQSSEPLETTMPRMPIPDRTGRAYEGSQAPQVSQIATPGSGLLLSAGASDQSITQAAPLPPAEMEYAKTAWRYFQYTTDPNTGLVRSTLKFPSTTMWDQGGYFLAIVSAFRLGLIDRDEAMMRASRAMHSLSLIPLNNGIFPNKAYSTDELEMTDYANKPVEHGIGYSALDIMRLLAGILAVEQHFVELQPQAIALRSGWPLHKLVQQERFYSTTTEGSKNKGLRQEGRIGYEQYAGRVGLQLGLDVARAALFHPILRWQAHNGVMIPGDRRLAATHGVDPVTTSEPFILEALEFGWRPELRQVAGAVFAAQVRRYETTGQFTALSEDHIAGAPYFAYGGILVGTKPFQSVTPGRKVVNNKRTISTKASFGWWALMDDIYGTYLIRQLTDLQTEYGWQAGVFEADGSANTIVTLNTNAVILEALHYRAFGPLIQDAFLQVWRMVPETAPNPLEIQETTAPIPAQPLARHITVTGPQSTQAGIEAFQPATEGAGASAAEPVQAESGELSGWSLALSELFNLQQR